MSQLNSIQSGPNFNAADSIQNAPQAGRASSAGERQGIADIVEKAELLPAQEPRVAQSKGPRVALVLARVVGAVLSLGISEGVIAIRNSVRAGNVQKAREEALERQAAIAQANENLADAVKSGEGLSDAHKAAIQEAIAKLCGDEFAAVLPDDLDASIDELSASVLNGSANPEEKADLNWGGFGAILPDGFDPASLDDLPTSALDSTLSSLVAEAVRSAPDEVTPEALKNIIIEKATPSLARSGVDLAFREAFTKLGFDANPGGIVGAFTSRHPELLQELEKCTHGRAVKEVMAKWQDKAESFTAYWKAKHDGKKAAVDHAIQSFASKFGVSVEAMGRALNTDKLKSSFSYVKFEPGATEAEIRKVYIEKAESFLAKKSALLDSVDQLNVPEDLKAFWKNEVLANSSLSSTDAFTKAVATASRVPASTIEGFEKLFAGGTPDADSVHAALQRLSIALGLASIEVHGQEGWRDLGGDGQPAAIFHSAKVLLTRMPYMKAVLENNPDLITEVFARMQSERYSDDRAIRTAAVQGDFLISALQTKNVDNAQLAASIGDLSKMPVHFLVELNKAEAAVRASFAGTDLPEDLLNAIYSNGFKVKNELIKLVENSPAGLGTADFRALAEQAFSRVAIETEVKNIVGKSVEYVDMSRFKGQGHDRNVSNVMSVLLTRHPELAQQKSTQALHDMLNSYSDSITVISRAISDNSKAWVAAEEHLYSRMAEVTGLPKDELREKFKPATIKSSGAFGAKAQEYYDALKDPNQPLAGAPTLEQQIREYTAIVDKIADRKTQLWDSVKHMNDLSPAFRAQLQLEALQQDSIKDGQFLEISHRMAGGLNDMLLKRAIESGNEEEVYSAIGALATQYTQFVNEIYGNFAQKLGVEDGGLVLPYTVRMFQDRTGLHSLAPEIFQTLFARLDEELRVAQERVMDLVGRGDADREAAMRDFQIASARVVFLEHMNPDQNRV